MEENRIPPTSTDPFVVEEPQEPARRAARAAEEAPAEAPGEPSGAAERQDAPITVDELLKTEASEAASGDGEGAEPQAADVDLQRAASILESLLLVSTEPLSIEKARKLLGELSRDQFEEVYLALRAKYPPESSGILVEKVAKGVQFRTNPANQEHVRRLFDVKPPRFSRAALETVAIIAYKQPLTRQEIEQIRGVDCAGSLKTLMDRRLVRVVGKKDVPGKPFLFGTTREFMEVFGLGSLGDLPSMREIEEYLSTSVATPVESGRPALDLPFAEGEASGEGVALEGAGAGEVEPPGTGTAEAAGESGRGPAAEEPVEGPSVEEPVEEPAAVDVAGEEPPAAEGRAGEEGAPPDRDAD